MPTERVDQPTPRPLVTVVAGITPEAIQTRMRRWRNSSIPEAKKIQPHLDVALRQASRLTGQIRGANALPETEELVLIGNAQQQITRAIQLEINELIKPNRNYSTAYDSFEREENGCITAVVQYRKCPSLETVTSRDGYVYSWYLRKTEPVGAKTVYIKSRGDDARALVQANQPEQLVLRRKFQ